MTPLLRIADLRTWIPTPRGIVKAVDGVDVELAPGQAIGVVGESGSGKTMLARSIIGFQPPTAARSGRVEFDGRDLLALAGADLREVLGPQIAMIFQDPGRSLNPVVRIGRQLTEGMRKHLGMSRSEAETRAVALLSEVGVPDPERRLRNYPHELSGGMRQRVMIAIALSCEPQLLIADEPTTALDVTVQRQILDLLRRVQRDHGTSMILISHDLAVVAGHTDRVAVMYAGRIAETGATTAVFGRPTHRYTAALLGATPSLDHVRHAPLQVIDGGLPDLADPPPGCLFAPRCATAEPGCAEAPPALLPVAADAADHVAACLVPVGARGPLTRSGGTGGW